MREMKNTNRAVISLVLIAAFCGTFALAQTAKPKTKTETGDWETRAAEAIKEELSRLTYYYKPTDDQKAKLKKALIAQYKDLMDHDKIRSPKIKALDDEIAAVKKKIAALEKEVAAIEKRKTVHTKARAELLLDHKAEINTVITREMRVARLSRYIRGSAVYSQYWGFLPKATQDSLTEQCNAAALELIEAGKEDDKDAVYEAYRKIRTTAAKVLTPKVRKDGDTKNLMDSTMRGLNRIKLTEAQLAAVREMCEKAVKRKVELYAQYVQIEKDRSAIRRTRSEMSSSNYYRKIRDKVIQDLLTADQLKKGGFKRKSSKRT